MRLCDLLFFIVFPEDFLGFLLLRGRYVRLISGLFSHRFLYRFFVVFWFDLGVMLGGFWEGFGRPNRSFLASIFD